MKQWPTLQRFWDRALNPDFPRDADDSAHCWEEEVMCLQRLGIGMEPALQFLHSQRPTLSEFEHWLSEHRCDSNNDAATAIEEVLSADDLAFWRQNGYVVVRDAVPKQQCLNAQNAIWEFLQADVNDPASWYRPHEGKRGLMLTLFDHPALEVNRQSPRVYHAYRQLYDGAAMYRTIDKVSFNPPEHASFRFLGSPLHWDVSLVPPIPHRLQGLLYLTDCSARDGAFHCVPGFHRRVDEWLASLPADADPRELALRQLQPEPVPGKAGDFVIWHQALPHCATPNRGKTPRMVQYLTYFPEIPLVQKVWR